MTVTRRLALYLVAIALAGACGGTVAPPTDPLAGTYTVKGGGAALDVFQALSDAFRKQHSLVRFSFQDIGSRAGMILVASGEVDLATSSAIPPAEITNAVTVAPIGSSGTAVIVNAQNPVAALTKAQVRDIFSGKASDWSAVGGASQKITLVIREASSALRSNFDTYFFGGTGVYRADAIVLNSGDDIIRAVASESSVVSMVTISAATLADTRVRGVAIEGIAPTKDNITNGRYPVVRPLFLVYSDKTLKPAIAAFLEFVRSAEGKRVIDLATTGG